MKIKTSIGEAVDKLSILFIKMEKITDPVKLQNVKKEYDYLSKELLKRDITVDHELFKNILEVNRRLWDIEDFLREKELKKEFDEAFISVARSVYKTNEERSKWKRELDNLFNSHFSEEKQYAAFQ